MLRTTLHPTVYLALGVTYQQLSWLLDGLSIYQKNAFNEVLKRKII